jgi:hypothetical protein
VKEEEKERMCEWGVENIILTTAILASSPSTIETNTLEAYFLQTSKNFNREM